MSRLQDFLKSDLFYFSFRVDDKLRVQIADNALSRDLFPADYHCLGDNENRPIKWLSIESLAQNSFSPASEVVSSFLKLDNFVRGNKGIHSKFQNVRMSEVCILIG